MVAGSRANPSLLNISGPDAFSQQDIDTEKEWVSSQAKVQRPSDFGDRRTFEDVRINERCCWICENWIQEPFIYIPGWSGPETTATEVEEVFVYFSIDGF